MENLMLLVSLQNVEVIKYLILIQVSRALNWY